MTYPTDATAASLATMQPMLDDLAGDTPKTKSTPVSDDLTFILAHCELYIPILKDIKGEFYTPEMQGAGSTMDMIVQDIMDGQHENLARILCIWGPNAGTDQTETVRNACLDAADFDGREHCDFVTAHEDYEQIEEAERRSWEAEQRHQQMERNQ